MSEYPRYFRAAILQALAHDVVNTAKAAAYSGMLMFFPALLVITTLIARMQQGPSYVGEARAVLQQFLPPGTLDLVQTSVMVHHIHSGQLILSATILSLFAGLGVMLSLMEGFRRAYQLPPEDWTFWARRARALMLVPIALVPLSLASVVIVFGHEIELWMVLNAEHRLRFIVIFCWRMARWLVTLVAIAGVLTVLYHFGTRRKEHWLRVLPGAITGTLIWFPSTLAYGWYVTRVADYTRLYGSFAAGIATLVWLYLTSFSVLIGAELNGVLYWQRNNRANGPVSAVARLLHIGRAR